MIAELDLPLAAPVSPPPAEPPPRKLTATISASRLGCWLACRLKFFFRYVERIAKPNTPALHIHPSIWCPGRYSNPHAAKR